MKNLFSSQWYKTRNHRGKKSEKNTNLEIKQHATEQPMSPQRNQIINLKNLDTNENRSTTYQNLYNATTKKSGSRREVLSNIGLPQERRKILNKNFTSKETRKRKNAQN